MTYRYTIIQATTNITGCCLAKLITPLCWYCVVLGYLPALHPIVMYMHLCTLGLNECMVFLIINFLTNFILHLKKANWILVSQMRVGKKPLMILSSVVIILKVVDGCCSFYTSQNL